MGTGSPLVAISFQPPPVALMGKFGKNLIFLFLFLKLDEFPCISFHLRFEQLDQRALQKL